MSSLPDEAPATTAIELLQLLTKYLVGSELDLNVFTGRLHNGEPH